MKHGIIRITLSLLIFSLARCSLLPPSGALPTPSAMPPSIPPSGYEPQPGDANLKRDQVFLELASGSGFVMTDNDPSQVIADIRGNLPDPCRQLRVVVNPPDENNVINLEVYSLVQPGTTCINVLEPFAVNIPLGSYSGQYTVMVNGERLGLFDIGSGSAPAVPVTP